MKKKLRIGLVGCGGIAGAHLGGYRAVGNCEVVAVYDPVARAAEARAGETGARVAKSVKEMITLDGLDAVSVCSPPAAHLDNCRPFLSAGIGVLCEKPLGVDAAMARRLAKAVEKSRAPFMVAFCHRFHPPVLELKELIKKGVLGKPMLFRNIFGGYGAMKRNHRNNPELSGGGCLIDHCCHSVDLFRFLVGDPTHVQAVAGNVLQNLRIEDFGIIDLQVRDKVFGQITASYSLKVCGNWVEWYGSKGTAIISYWNEGHPDLAYRLEGGTWTTVDCSKRPDRFAGEIGHFLDCIRKGRKPSITVQDGLKSNVIAKAIYASADDGVRRQIRY